MGGTEAGDAFDDIPVGSLPVSSGRTMHFSGMTVLRVENGPITEELGVDEGVTALKMLGLVPQREREQVERRTVRRRPLPTAMSLVAAAAREQLRT